MPMLPLRAFRCWLLLLGLPGTLAAQSIACEKYHLDNGMTVILHQDHSLPVATINTWYRVGSKDEPPGRSGFAHLFEHLMFMGTRRAPGNDFDNVMEAGGGSNNASTTQDRTNYFSSGPSALLPTLLWLDADRLEDLGRTMDQPKLDRQRDIVRNEIRESVENRPYGRAEELVFRLMFPAGHPYHEAVYGTHPDLEAATVDNVKDFFATFYVPNNAALVVAGDFDPASIKPLIASLFGTLPRGGEVTRKPVVPLQLDHVARATMLDKVQLPLVKMAWHSPVGFSDGDAELRLLAAVLSSGKTSRLYKRLVFDDRIAVDVDAAQDGLALGSLFAIDVTGVAGADLDRIERSVDEELARVVRDGITAAELDERKASYERRQLESLQSLGAVADKLNEYEFAWGEPNSFARDLERFRAVTPAKVQAWARQVLDPSRRAVIRVLPAEPEGARSARDQQPAAAPSALFVPPAPEQFQLDNGMPVLLWQRPQLPLVALRVQFQPGDVLVTDPARAGLPALTAAMLREGAGELDALAFAQAMQSLGAAFATAVDQEMATATLTVLKRNFARATGLLADALRRPRLQPADWERIKRLHLEQLRQQDDEPELVAGRVGQRVLFGADNPYGWSTDGEPATVGPLTLADAQAEHGALFTPRTAVVFVAGDVTVAEARAVLGKTLGDWPFGPALQRRPPDFAAKPSNALRVVLVDRPAAVQTVIRFLAPGPGYRAPQRLHLQLLNTLLGGTFTSRLNQNLREHHGYAYGAGSRYSMAPYSGHFLAAASVKAEVTGAALTEFLAEFARLTHSASGDIAAAEAEKARATVRTEFIQAFGSLQGVLQAAAERTLNGLPFASLAADFAQLDTITAAELNALCQQALPIEQGVLVLVGDRQLILEQSKPLGLPAPIELDVHAQPVRR